MEQSSQGLIIKYRHHTEQQLIREILDGDRNAAVYLLTHVMSPNFRYLIQCKFRDTRIEFNELVNDLYLHLEQSGWRALTSFKGDSSLTTYLEKIAYNFIYKKYFAAEVKEKRSLVALETLSRDIAEPGADLARVMVDILQLIPHLKRREQQVIRFYLQDLKPKEIGKLMDTSANSVMIIKSRACGHLRELLNNKKV